MTVINQSGVPFSIETGGKTHAGWDKKYTHTDNLVDGVYDPDPQNIIKSLNAVEIDWHGVVWSAIPNITTAPASIYTTGDLLKAIKYAANQGSQYVHDKFTPHNLGLYKVQVNEEGHISNAVAVQKSDLIDLVYDLIQEGNHIEKTKTSDGIKIDCTIDVEPTPDLPEPTLECYGTPITSINDGETIQITVRSNVYGRLILETPEGYGWTATSSSETSPYILHTLNITNTTDIITASTINAGDIRVKFIPDPDNTEKYATLSNYPILDYDIHLGAGAPKMPNFVISNPSSTTLAKGESATITITTSDANAEGKFEVLTNESYCTITSSSASVAATTHTITIKNNANTAPGGTLSTIYCSWTPQNDDRYSFVRQYNVLNQDITLLAGEKITPAFRISDTPWTIEYGQSATIGIESSHLGWITLHTSGSGTNWSASCSTDSPNVTPTTQHTVTIHNSNSTSDAITITSNDLIAAFTPQDTTNVKSATLNNVLAHYVTLKTPTAKLYFSVGSTAVTASNYTDVNNPTTAIPTTTTFSTSVESYGYILAPSDKTVSVVNNANNNVIPITEQTNISIPGHKVYRTNGALNPGGTIRITLS